MDGALNPVETQNNYVLLYGDIGRVFVIVDHPGTTIEFLPRYGPIPADRSAAPFLFARAGSEVVCRKLLACSTSRPPQVRNGRPSVMETPGAAR